MRIMIGSEDDMTEGLIWMASLIVTAFTMHRQQQV